ncbi:MAG: DUF2062 domain-containing protein [Alphaproteobacteria bacterium]|nr:DUF2062 domain-containing protein [Alphaproteobacteria bacterium]
MFRRRKPLTKLQHIRELFWPSMGWRRTFRYLKLRITRLSDSTHSIALGLAIGVAISFNPFLGTHFIQAGILAWLFRANLFCALLATFAANPWTFPFIWWAGIKFGFYFFAVFGLDAAAAPPSHLDFSVLMHLLRNEPFHVLLPWTIGAYALGLISMPFTYMISYRLVKGAQQARRAAVLYKIHQVAHEITDQHT